MNLSDFLREADKRPATFAREIGVALSTLHGWMYAPGRWPSGSALHRVEQATGGKVTASDFAEPKPIPPRRAAFQPAQVA